jgi:hypothetical protein
MNYFTKIVFLLVPIFMSSGAWAYYDVMDTGEVMQDGKYKVTADSQLLTSRGGINLGGIFDMGFQQEFGLRAIVGVGTTDYNFGALFKWTPVPDTDNQPAVGFNLGLLYAKIDDDKDMTLRFEPLVSKKFNLERVVLTPYASLPISMRNRTSPVEDSSTAIGWQAVGGSQLKIEQWQNIQFMAEVGVDLGSNAYSHISAGAIWYFDNNGFVVK